jgi:O-antigen/teichoic acid export membrane protein
LDKYKKLIYNTFIFGIGTFSSKILVFLLLPLYTRVLTNADYGVVDLIVQTSNLLIPIISMGIANGVIRYGLDKSYKKSDVFTTGLITILAGFLIFLLFEPLISKIKYISEYSDIIYFYVLMSSLRSLCSQFVRSKNMVKLYAFDGVLSTITTTSITILFLVKLKLGVNGYLLAIILSDFLSSVFLIITAKLYKYVKFNFKNKFLPKEMILYSIPLIPTTIFWWITNVSDRFIVAYMLGTEANGLYAISYKIPTIITLISSIFTEAWQISAVGEKSIDEREKFFTNVFKSYASIIFIAASALILFVKVITKLLVSNSFYPSWQYVPFLVMATSYSCLVNFLGSIYFVEKKSNLSLITTLVGAIINIILNFILIPKLGINGASFATFISFSSVFILRALNTRKFIKIKWNCNKLILNTFLLLIQSLIMIFEIPYWIIFEITIFIIMSLINTKDVLKSIRKLLKRKMKK